MRDTVFQMSLRRCSAHSPDPCPWPRLERWDESQCLAEPLGNGGRYLITVENNHRFGNSHLGELPRYRNCCNTVSVALSITSRRDGGRTTD